MKFISFVILLGQCVGLITLSTNPNIRSKFSSDIDIQTCGTIQTREETITLYDGVALTSELFKALYQGKLEGAVISPVVERKCAIQICGFNSWGLQYEEGYIGTTSDYADCEMFVENTSALIHTYNAKYNASSIACGCDKDESQCNLTCPDRASNMVSKWTNTSCAVFYQELACGNCHLPAFTLHEGENFTTNYTLHVRTMVVREGCQVKQFSPELKRFWLFRNVDQPFIYNAGPIINNVNSPFIYNQQRPDTFMCKCGIQPAPTPTPPTPHHKKSYLYLIIFIICGVGGVGASIVIFMRIKLRRHSLKSSDRELIISTSSLTIDESESIIPIPLVQTLDTPRSLFNTESPLATGNFGQVYAGTLRVAIKTVKTSLDLEEDKKNAIHSLQQEVKILTQLGFHENVVRILGTALSEESIEENYLLLELCLCSLHYYLKSAVKPSVIERLAERTQNGWSFSSSNGYVAGDEATNAEEDEELTMETLDPDSYQQFNVWSYQIASGMQYIQSKNIVHVDLAARNVLLTYKLVAKIGDFGLSKKTYLKNYANFRKDALPLRWAAIECFDEFRVSLKSDVWSFGITLWEMFSLGDTPYSDLTLVQIISTVYHGHRLSRPQMAPKHIYEKLQQCWKEKPEDRPSFDDLVDYFKSLSHHV